MKNLEDIYAGPSSTKSLDSFKNQCLGTSSSFKITYKESKKPENFLGYDSSSSSSRIDSESEVENPEDNYIEKLAKGVTIDSNTRKVKQKEYVPSKDIKWLGEKPTHIESHSLAPLNNPKTIYRDSKGVVINEKEPEKKINVNEERLKFWASGDVQRKEKESLHNLIEKEKNNPFARHDIDNEFKVELKKRQRFGDPIAEFGNTAEKKIKFMWENRFLIKPGKMWDGVDRTNGFEQKWLAKQGRKVWENSVAYKNFASEL